VSEKDQNISKKEELSEGFLKFQKAMKNKTSSVSKLLNCHLLAEYFLEQIIHISIKRGDILLTEARPMFSLKLIIVKSLDVVDDSIITSIKHLNTVRNLCSHEMEYEITEANIDLIGRPFGKDYTEIRNKKFDERLERVLMMVIARLEATYEFELNKSDRIPTSLLP